MISAAGDVDLATVGVLQEALHAAMRAECHIVLDLGHVTHFDQVGFRVCLACWRSCRRHRRVLALTNPAPVVRKVVKILDVDRLLPLFASVGEASAALLERSR